MLQYNGGENGAGFRDFTSRQPQAGFLPHIVNGHIVQVLRDATWEDGDVRADADDQIAVAVVLEIALPPQDLRTSHAFFAVLEWAA